MSRTSPIVLVPSRIGSTRFPAKPLADLNGEPMIAVVWRRAMEADVGPVYIATDSEEIAEAVRAIGGAAVLTSDRHQSGADRIAEALCQVDPDHRHDVIVNLQGDLPTVLPQTIQSTLALLGDRTVAVGTPVCKIQSQTEAKAESVVKMVGTPLGGGRHRALYFTRLPAPWGAGLLYHHIGLYAWRREALERFVLLPQSYLELRERLEQLRAVEAGEIIHAVEVDEIPVGVDTAADLIHARDILLRRFRQLNPKISTPHAPKVVV